MTIAAHIMEPEHSGAMETTPLIVPITETALVPETTLQIVIQGLPMEIWSVTLRVFQAIH